MADLEKGDVTSEACRVLELTSQLIAFGVTAVKVRDVLRGRKFQGSKALVAAGGNAAENGMLKEWNQAQVDELIQLMLQHKVLKEEKETIQGKGKGKGWKAPKRLREGTNADKLRKGDITLLMPNCPKAAPSAPSEAAPEATEALRTPPPAHRRDSAEADPSSPAAPKRRRLRKAKEPSVENLETTAAAAIDVEQQLVACDEQDPGSPKAEETDVQDQKVPDSMRFQRFFAAKSPRKSTAKRQSKAGGRRLTLVKDDEEEEGWPPVHSDSSGDEMVWIGGGQRASPVLRRPKPAAHPPLQAAQAPEAVPLQQSFEPPPPQQANSPGRRLPWQSNVAQAPEAVPLQQSFEPPPPQQANSPGRRLPWQSNVVAAPQPLVQLPVQAAPSTAAPTAPPAPVPAPGPSRAARRNQLRVATA